ncbi:MAG: tail fiber domain-containing protein [Mangrovibacterium sp.]
MKNFSTLFINCGKQSLAVFIIFVCCFLGIRAYPQLKIVSSGNVGVDATNPLSRFSVGTDGVATSKVYILNSNTSGDQRGLTVDQAVSNGSWSHGIFATVLTGSSGVKALGLRGVSYKSTSSTSGRAYAVYGVGGNASSGWNYAVYGQLLGSNNGTAVFAATPDKGETSVNGMYAGYFRGKVFIEDLVGIKTTSAAYDLDVNGTIRCVSLIQSSDLSLKKEVKDMERGSLGNLAKIKGVKYKLKTPEELGLSTAPTVPSDTGDVSVPVNILSPEHFTKEYTGFIAQDVQKVFPDLVSRDADGKLAIDYLGLIPVLVEAIKEQQAEIEALKKQVNQ